LEKNKKSTGKILHRIQGKFPSDRIFGSVGDMVGIKYKKQQIYSTYLDK